MCMFFFTFHTCFRKQGEGGFQRDFFRKSPNENKKTEDFTAKKKLSAVATTHMEKRPRLVCNFRKIKL